MLVVVPSEGCGTRLVPTISEAKMAQTTVAKIAPTIGRTPPVKIRNCRERRDPSKSDRRSSTLTRLPSRPNVALTTTMLVESAPQATEADTSTDSGSAVVLLKIQK